MAYISNWRFNWYSVVELFPDAVLAIMVEDALYDDVPCLKKLLSTSTIEIMDSSTDLLCGGQEGEDRRQGCQGRLAHCLLVQFQFEKTNLIISVAGSVLQYLDSAFLITWIFKEQTSKHQLR